VKKLLPALLGLVLVLILWPRPQSLPPPSTPPPAPSPPPLATTPPSPPRVRPPAQPSQPAFHAPDPRDLLPIPPHPDAVFFGSPAFPPEQEPERLHDLFRIYRERFGSFPSGENNAQLMNALRGNNPQRLGIFPLQHPRLDAEGNLLDAWGTPFFFHLLSRDELDIRSAGPDRQLYTPDDLLFPPPR
jgi:hypothetical protein